jgi:hypothetical protein
MACPKSRTPTYGQCTGGGDVDGGGGGDVDVEVHVGVGGDDGDGDECRRRHPSADRPACAAMLRTSGGYRGRRSSTPKVRQQPQPQHRREGSADRLKSVKRFQFARVKPPSFFDPSGSRTTSNWRIGPSVTNSALIRSRSSSSVAPSAGPCLTSPASLIATASGDGKPPHTARSSRPGPWQHRQLSSRRAHRRIFRPML